MPSSPEGALLDGRYRVLRHLGSGGMASVVLCRDERLDRDVAVKRLHADSPADVEQRFVREAKLGASLNHPNLVSVFDTATDDEGVLIVMEYVDGEALARTLGQGALKPQRVSAMMRDLGEALDYAHGHGVVHRDVKPGNVLLRRDGVTKLVDLGIATASDQTRITRSGMVLGTAAYMAPEQLEGGETGPATDIYALGAVAYESLSGEKPRSGRTPVEIAHQIASGPPRDLREDMPDAPPAAAEVLRQAMARDPAERPESAGELAMRLSRALEDGEEATAPTRPVRRASRAAAAGAAAAGGAAAASAAAADATAPTAERRAGPAAPPPRVADPAGATRRPRTRAARETGAKRPVGAIVLAVAFLALTAATIIGAILTSGGGDEPAQRQAQNGAETDRGSGEQQRPATTEEEPATQEEQPPAEEEQPPAEEEQPPAEEEAPATDPARGVQLNDQGFELIQQGDYAGAVPILEQAVASFPEDSQDLNYAYALFNLGQALNRSGRPDEAIPFLERRLAFSNQRGVVRQELELARESAGGD